MRLSINFKSIILIVALALSASCSKNIVPMKQPEPKRIFLKDKVKDTRIIIIVFLGSMFITLRILEHKA